MKERKSILLKVDAQPWCLWVNSKDNDPSDKCCSEDYLICFLSMSWSAAFSIEFKTWRAVQQRVLNFMKHNSRFPCEFIGRFKTSFLLICSYFFLSTFFFTFSEKKLSHALSDFVANEFFLFYKLSQGFDICFLSRVFEVKYLGSSLQSRL